MIITNELGLNFCENPWQGSVIIDELTDPLFSFGSDQDGITQLSEIHKVRILSLAK